MDFTDLNERNCMRGTVLLHGLSRTAKYEALGRPLKEAIPFVDIWYGQMSGSAT